MIQIFGVLNLCNSDEKWVITQMLIFDKQNHNFIHSFVDGGLKSIYILFFFKYLQSWILTPSLKLMLMD